MQNKIFCLWILSAGMLDKTRERAQKARDKAEKADFRGMGGNVV